MEMKYVLFGLLTLMADCWVRGVIDGSANKEDAKEDSNAKAGSVVGKSE